MKESISNAMVFNIVIAVIGVCMVLILTSLSYSKTYKIKNRIVNILEKHGQYNNAEVRDEIESYLKTAGYSSVAGVGEECPTIDDKTAINTLNKYAFCIYETFTTKGHYYTVTAYMTYDFPVLSDFLRTRYSISGESKIIYNF